MLPHRLRAAYRRDQYPHDVVSVQIAVSVRIAMRQNLPSPSRGR
jgi:hypothetical protein